MSLVTYLDDFYSGFSYIGNWITPDTSLNSYTSFSNPSYFDGTYHSTTTTNDVVSLNFTGSISLLYLALNLLLMWTLVLPLLFMEQLKPFQQYLTLI